MISNENLSDMYDGTNDYNPDQLNGRIIFTVNCVYNDCRYIDKTTEIRGFSKSRDLYMFMDKMTLLKMYE